MKQRMRGRQFGAKRTPPKEPETEADKNRRRVREWLRERDEHDTDEFERDE